MLLARRPKQRERLDTDQVGEALDGLEAEIALAALDAAEIRVVKRERASERFLSLAESLPTRAYVAADQSLQVPFHTSHAGELRLDSPQTDE